MAIRRDTTGDVPLEGIRIEGDGRPRQRRRLRASASTKQNPGDGSQRLYDWRHELIARYVGLKGMEPQEAWRIVYDQHEAHAKTAKKQSYLITQCNKAVVLRIQHFADLAVMREIEHTAVTREWVEKEMVSAYNEAAGDRDHKAAIKALELLGINVGMFVRRSDVTVRKTAVELGDHGQILEQLVMLIRKAIPGIDGQQIRTMLATQLGVTIDVEALPPEKTEPAPIEIASVVRC